MGYVGILLFCIPKGIFYLLKGDYRAWGLGLRVKGLGLRVYYHGSGVGGGILSLKFGTAEIKEI